MGVQAPSAFARDERELIGIALALGAARSGELTDHEREHQKTATRVPDTCAGCHRDRHAGRFAPVVFR